MNFNAELERLLAKHPRIAEQEAPDEKRVSVVANEQVFVAGQRANGFPLRAIEAAQGANEQAPAIVAISQWEKAGFDIAVLAGSAGCGKTVAATWWCINRMPYRAKFGRAAEFAVSSRYNQEQRDWWLSADALVLDDLGAEFVDAKGSFASDLDGLIDSFYADKRKLIITTNCDATAFKARYGERIADRIRECGKFITIGGESMRRKS